MPHFTPTQKRILAVLSDGLPHHADELRAVLCDDMACRSTLSVHLTNIRERLAPIGQDIVYRRIGGQFQYLHIRVTSLNDE